MLGIAVPASTLAIGGYRMQARFDVSAQDATTRTGHWEGSLSLLGSNTFDWLTGIGLGSFPRQYILLSPPSQRVGTYQYTKQGDNHVLHLGGGRDLRLGQRIADPPPAENVLVFSGRTRWHGMPSKLNGSVCRRRLLEQVAYNPSCTYFSVSPGEIASVWTPFSKQIRISKLGRDSLLSPRFTLLGIGNTKAGSLLEVDNLRLTDAYGTNYLHNGSFEQGGSGWCSYNDFEHLAWHPKNLFLYILIEQGVLGVIAFAGLFLVAMRNAWRLARAQRPFGIGLAAMGAGILILGLVATITDVPRTAFLLYLLLLIAATMGVSKSGKAGEPRS
jgi:hypothetical protein